MSKTKQYLKTLKAWRNVAIFLLITAVLFVLVEGLASTAIAAIQVMRSLRARRVSTTNARLGRYT